MRHVHRQRPPSLRTPHLPNRRSDKATTLATVLAVLSFGSTSCTIDDAPETLAVGAHADFSYESDGVVIKVNRAEGKPGVFKFSALPASSADTIKKDSYRWTFGKPRSVGGVNASSKKAPEINFSEPGYYQVRLEATIVRNPLGVADTATAHAVYTIAVVGTTKDGEEIHGLNPSNVNILAYFKANESGEVPLDVRFGYRSARPLTVTGKHRPKWFFGDGKKPAVGATPQRRYTDYGRYEVLMRYTDELGRPGVARYQLSVRPSKTDLMRGLKSMKRLGVWASNFRTGTSRADATFNENRWEDLHNMNVTTYIPSLSVHGYQSAARRDHILAQLDRAERYGIETGLEIVGNKGWFRNSDRPRRNWNFAPDRGIDALNSVINVWAAQADPDLKTAWNLSRHPAVSWVYVGHEIGEQLNHSQRKTVHRETKKLFPNLATVAYHDAVHLSYERAANAPLRNRPGETHGENRIRAGEADITFLGAEPPRSTDENGHYVADAARTRASLAQQARHLNRRDVRIWNNKKVWFNVNLPGEYQGLNGARTDKPSDMWTPNDFLDYARVLLNYGGIDMMSFRAFGRFPVDLAMGLNTANRARPETGHIAQRLAVRTIGGWIKQARAGRPILIIKSPEIASSRASTFVNVDYQIIGASATRMRAVFKLNRRREIRMPVGAKGSVRLNSLSAGDHTLLGHLVNAQGKRVVDSEVKVTFRTARRNRPLHAINVGSTRSFTAADGTTYRADRTGHSGRTRANGGSRQEVESTDDDPLYRSARAGTVSYSLSAQNGALYRLILKFNETEVDRVNRRVFDVYINGTVRVRNVDVRAAAGQLNNAFDLSLNVVAQNGRIRIELVPVKGEPFLNALVVERRNTGR